MHGLNPRTFFQQLGLTLLLGGLIYAPLDVQAQGGPATPVALSYKEPVVKEVKKCTGGGLFGAMECVTKRMEGVAEAIEGADAPGARLALKLTAELEVLPPLERYTVRIRGGAALPEYHGELKPESKVLVQADAASIAQRFAALAIVLDAAQVETLKRDGKLSLDITSQFDGLQKLALEASPVLLNVELSQPVCVFVERDDVPDFAEMVRRKKIETDRAAGRLEASQ